MHVLNPLLRIQDTFHDFIGAHQKVTRRSSKAMTSDYLRDLGLPARVLAAYPHQLSGGMRQRVTIALATILRPALIFADEPTTALDVIVQRGVIELLKEVRTQRGSTMVVVTHDMGVHANLSDRIAVLYAGELVEEADTLSIFQQPRHPYTQHLIQSLPRLDDKTERLSLSGRPPSLDDVPSGCRFHPRCPYAMPVCREVRPPMVAVRDAGGSQHRVACHLIAEGTSAGGSRADA
jgi:peptide/nickel transport system ATP-binding protein